MVKLTRPTEFSDANVAASSVQGRRCKNAALGRESQQLAVRRRDRFRPDVHDRMALPGGSGGVPQFWLGVVIETIDGQGATEAPQESEARLQALLSSLDDLVFELDENGTYLKIWTANDALLAVPRGELIGRTHR
jgi:PAS domain-containing protein